jgi:hypothetical protein
MVENTGRRRRLAPDSPNWFPAIQRGRNGSRVHAADDWLKGLATHFPKLLRGFV